MISKNKGEREREKYNKMICCMLFVVVVVALARATNIILQFVKKKGGANERGKGMMRVRVRVHGKGEFVINKVVGNV